MSELPVVLKRKPTLAQPIQDISFIPEFNNKNDEFLNFRKENWKIYQDLSVPTKADEAWKRTNISELHLEQLNYGINISARNQQIPDSLTQSIIDGQDGGQIILDNGKTQIHLEDELSQKGVIFTDLEHAETEYPVELSLVIQKIKKKQVNKFEALARSLNSTGVLIYIPKNINIEKPLHTVNWMSEEGQLYSAQVFIYLEEGASATVLVENSSPNYLSMHNMFAGNINIYVGPNAKLNFVELQSFGTNTWNFCTENVNVDQDGEIDWVFGALGSKVTKSFSTLNLIGSGSIGKMSGFYFADGNQHLDHDTQQNHLAPNSTSDLLFKGALIGEGRSVWRGMIYVDPKATKTDGYQVNRNLILSDKAHADSIPGLEILTDDVRCSHGASIGKINKDEIFYLESRGIPRKEAERLIVEGFYDPIMQRIPFFDVRKRFQSAIHEKMSNY